MEGERAVAGLGAPVRIERDALGVPVVRGGSRLDVARATGFLHAQERFFQMDLLRRSAAGELAALFGRPALEMDREARVLRLRLVARRAVKALRADERDMLAAYTAGANAGLAALGAPPFEYLALRAEPAPWRDEDSLLCALAMYRDLQGRQPWQESVLGAMRETLPPALAAFLAPVGTEWDAPIEGGPIPMPAVPGPEVVDLRRAQADAAAARALPPSEPGVLAVLGAPVGLGRRATTTPASAAATTGRWRGRTPRTAARSSPTTCTSASPCRTPGTALSLVFPGADGAEARHGRHAAGRALRGRGQQRPRRLGLHEQRGRLGRPRPPRARPGEPRGLPHAGGPADARARDRDDRGEGREGGDAGRRVDDLGAGDRQGRRRPPPGARLGRAARGRPQRGARAHGVGPRPRRGPGARPRGRHPEPELRRAPTRPGASAGPSSAASRAASASTGACPRRGRTGRGAGTAGSRGAEYPRVVDPPSGRIWTANARVVDGEKLAKVGDGGYDLGARPGPDPRRPRSPSTRRARATCCASSSTTARSSSRAGRSCSSTR